MESWRLTFDSPLSSLIKSNVMRRLVAATPRDRHLDNVARMSVISCAYHVEFVFPSGSCPKLGHRREGIFKAKVGQTRRTAHWPGGYAQGPPSPRSCSCMQCGTAAGGYMACPPPDNHKATFRLEVKHGIISANNKVIRLLF